MRMYSENDFRLYHAWGKSPDQKLKEHEYNIEYYRQHKEQWEKYRKNADRKYRNAVGRMQSYKRGANKHKIEARKQNERTDDKWGRWMPNSENPGWIDMDRGIVHPGSMPPLEYEMDRIAAQNERKKQGEQLNKLYTKGVREASDARNYREVANRNFTNASKAYDDAVKAYSDYKATVKGKLASAYSKGKQAFEDALKKLKK